MALGGYYTAGVEAPVVEEVLGAVGLASGWGLAEAWGFAYAYGFDSFCG